MWFHACSSSVRYDIQYVKLTLGLSRSNIDHYIMIKADQIIHNPPMMRIVIPMKALRVNYVETMYKHFSAIIREKRINLRQNWWSNHGHTHNGWTYHNIPMISLVLCKLKNLTSNISIKSHGTIYCQFAAYSNTQMVVWDGVAHRKVTQIHPIVVDVNYSYMDCLHSFYQILRSLGYMCTCIKIQNSWLGGLAKKLNIIRFDSEACGTPKESIR